MSLEVLSRLSMPWRSFLMLGLTCPAQSSMSPVSLLPLLMLGMLKDEVSLSSSLFSLFISFCTFETSSVSDSGMVDDMSLFSSGIGTD